ncbi:hypothetical protein GCM10007338_19360 [Corynebacterium pelargi]|nr:hypothetical protein GCM10007338_19360 [Corynebacterium pelargi]
MREGWVDLYVGDIAWFAAYWGVFACRVIVVGFGKPGVFALVIGV